jgi:hypothetical protein
MESRPGKPAICAQHLRVSATRPHWALSTPFQVSQVQESRFRRSEDDGHTGHYDAGIEARSEGWSLRWSNRASQSLSLSLRVSEAALQVFSPRGSGCAGVSGSFSDRDCSPFSPPSLPLSLSLSLSLRVSLSPSLSLSESLSPSLFLSLSSTVASTHTLASPSLSPRPGPGRSRATSPSSESLRLTGPGRAVTPTRSLRLRRAARRRYGPGLASTGARDPPWTRRHLRAHADPLYGRPYSASVCAHQSGDRASD